MIGKSAYAGDKGRAAAPRASPAVADPGSGRFLHEIESLSKALCLDHKNPPPPRRRALPSSSSSSSTYSSSERRSVSAGRPHSIPSDSKPTKQQKSSSSSKEKEKEKKKPSSSSSIWNWKPIRALSHLGHRRLDCRFSLHVHSIEGIPPALSAASLAVHWRRTTDAAASAGATRPAPVVHGVAEFEETLFYRCSVYGARSGPNNSAKYEPRQFLIYPSVVSGAPGLDLGRHLVDLTRVLPLDLDELEDEEDGKGCGKWSTSFRLSGKARGASLNVSFGFSLVGGGSSNSSAAQRKVSDISNSKDVRPDRVTQHSSIAPGGNQVRRHDRSRSVEDVRVLHEVLLSSKSEVVVLANDEREPESEKYDTTHELNPSDGDATREFKVVTEDEEVIKTKPCMLLESVERSEGLPEVKPCSFSEPVKESDEKECPEPEFVVTEQGIEISSDGNLGMVDPAEEDEGEGKGGEQDGLNIKLHEPVAELSNTSSDLKDIRLIPEDLVTNDLVSSVSSLSNLEVKELDSLDNLVKPFEELGYSDVESTASLRSRSLSLDDVTESVASEFLSMLGIEHSPFGLSSDSDPESPSERLWKQFEKETLVGSGRDIFGVDTEIRKESNWGDLSDDFDLSLIVQEAEAELQKVTHGTESKSRAKMLEDAETEALMREWGLDEKAFQSSPPGSKGGFGSPIDLPPEEPLDLPPLSKGLGPFLQTKDGGFLRSMNPSLFKNAKHKGSLIMQVSCPIVVPVEMGSGVMEILQSMASIGIEKLSVQANKLMPLEDITGKTLHQVAWETTPALADDQRKYLSQHQHLDTGSSSSISSSFKKNTHKGLDQFSPGGKEMGSEYVSLEDLAPLAMDKIEALSMEGLRIQSGMSDEEAPSNISPQSIGELSALEGKGAQNRLSLGMEGTAGLQLLDIKDSGENVDGPMGLSISLDEWMRLDSGIVDDEDQISDRTAKILAAHGANSMDLISGAWKGDKRGGKKSGRRWGFLGNNFTVALMVQLRDPLRNYEPVGTPMLSLVQVERVFIPPKPKIYCSVSEKGNSEQEDDIETESKALTKEENNEEEEACPQFKITEVHVAGLKTEPGKRKVWGKPVQQQSGSRWLLAAGMGKSNKHPIMKSKAVTKSSQGTTTVQPGDTLWSISSRVHGTGAKWKELAALNPHIRNPNIIFPNETIRLR